MIDNYKKSQTSALSPELLKARGIGGGVADSVLNVEVAEIFLNQPRIWGLGSSGTVNWHKDSRKGFSDDIDTATPSGRFFFHVTYSLTKMKRQMTDSKIE
jgi:hypothetical protein